ncbi:MAG: hypothetical protein HKN68_18645 [Saprospiraceae bacterium]|nr:hypothetical protein [Saprospiraceae bacterium]
MTLKFSLVFYPYVSPQPEAEGIHSGDILFIIPFYDLKKYFYSTMGNRIDFGMMLYDGNTHFELNFN